MGFCGFFYCAFSFFSHTISRFPDANQSNTYKIDFFSPSKADSLTQILLMFPFLPCRFFLFGWLVFLGVFFGPLLKGTCRLLFKMVVSIRPSPARSRCPASAGSSTITLCPPEQAELHLMEQTGWQTRRPLQLGKHCKLPNASPTLVLRTRDSTLTACSYLEHSGKFVWTWVLHAVVSVQWSCLGTTCSDWLPERKAWP